MCSLRVCARGILYGEMPPEPFDSDFGLWPSEIYMPKYNEPVAPARVARANCLQLQSISLTLFVSLSLSLSLSHWPHLPQPQSSFAGPSLLACASACGSVLKGRWGNLRDTRVESERQSRRKGEEEREREGTICCCWWRPSVGKLNWRRQCIYCTDT